MKNLLTWGRLPVLAVLLNSPFFSSAQEPLAIEAAILNDPRSYYHVDFANYPKDLKDFPIGVFDSGTGGLTVLDALVNFDEFKNDSRKQGGDGQLDFQQERFIYLADQANMPYGNYHAVQKDDLLVEHILKDFQFLLGRSYYASPSATAPRKDKEPVKAIVIACNTATAYGYKDAEAFMAKTGLDIPVIGVINAAARGTLAVFGKEETGSIGVFATVGTIASGGYERTLREQIQQLGMRDDIQIFNQGGHGIAEAVDEEPDFIKLDAQAPRSNYRGPALDHSEYAIDRTLLDIYNFNFDKNQMLCDSKDAEDCSLLQINSSENYIRYHLVSLLEQMRKAPEAKPLKALILGCTHYPYLVKEINQVLEELRNYRGKDGASPYADLIHTEVHIIDPSVFVARELHEAMAKQELFSRTGDMAQSEFYISVPNTDNADVRLEGEELRFTYDYKYGRSANVLQEYVKVVPFDRSTISDATLGRFKTIIPNTYRLISNFSNGNLKVKDTAASLRIP